MPENPQPHESEPDEPGDTPVPNRRERRGGKSKATTPQGNGPVHRNQPPGVNPRQYTTRRRGNR